jgi:hypothetical protein
MTDWTEVHSPDEMQAFFRSRLPAIREAAKACGYAIGVHGSERRDFDLIAVPWVETYSTPDELAAAIMEAACGMTMAAHKWERKPNGRVAVSLPICWPEGFMEGALSLGMIDLSVMPAARAARQRPRPRKGNDVSEEPKYLIWSNEHRLWWRPDERGYCSLVKDAGRYSRADAIWISGMHDGWGPNGDKPEMPILEADAIECENKSRDLPWRMVQYEKADRQSAKRFSATTAPLLERVSET